MQHLAAQRCTALMLLKNMGSEYAELTWTTAGRLQSTIKVHSLSPHMPESRRRCTAGRLHADGFFRTTCGVIIYKCARGRQMASATHLRWDGCSGPLVACRRIGQRPDTDTGPSLIMSDDQWRRHLYIGAAPGPTDSYPTLRDGGGGAEEKWEERMDDMYIASLYGGRGMFCCGESLYSKGQMCVLEGVCKAEKIWAISLATTWRGNGGPWRVIRPYSQHDRLAVINNRTVWWLAVASVRLQQMVTLLDGVQCQRRKEECHEKWEGQWNLNLTEWNLTRTRPGVWATFARPGGGADTSPPQENSKL